VPRFPSSPPFAMAWLFVAAMCILLISSTSAAQDVASDNSSITGRLATVEPTVRRLTMIADGEVNLVEVFVAEDAAVVEDGRTLTLAQLVIRTGRRVTMAIRREGERRIATAVTVEPE
jgi:hypothetical protein